MKLAVITAATKSYLYAWPSFIRAIATAANHISAPVFIFATDESDESREAELTAIAELPKNWTVVCLRLPNMQDDAKDYQQAAQLRIAALQGAAFYHARKLGVDLAWSVESDVIVPANALRVLEWALDMPDASGSPIYHIAAATYPNGLFLGGHGTYRNPIAEDFLPSERKLSDRLSLCLAICEDRLKDKPTDREMRRMQRLQKRVKKCPADGNIWEVTAKHGYRKRGWLDFAYPGIGEGALVPSDWCGLGCTLLSNRALQLADFVGYTGQGTQDLFLCWHRWHPASLRIACLPHVPCDHIKRLEDGTLTHWHAYHEQAEEYRGHLRVAQIEWLG